MAVKFDVEMTQRTFPLSKLIRFRLTLANDGATPVEVPDPLLNELTPTYTITRPDGSQETVALGAARGVDAFTDPMAPPVRATTKLEGGGTWSEIIDLDPMITLLAPGDYSMQAAIEIDGKEVKAKPQNFHIVRADLEAFAATPASLETRDARLYTAFAYRAGAEHAIVESVRLGDLWGDDRRGRLYDLTIPLPGDGSVRQICIPATRHERGMDFGSWVVWYDGQQVWAQATDAGNLKGGPVSLLQRESELLLVDPPLMTTDHDLVVHVIDRSKDPCELIRIGLKRKDTKPDVTSTNLPYRVAAAGAVHFMYEDKPHSVLVVDGTKEDKGLLSFVDITNEPAVMKPEEIGTSRPLTGRSLYVTYRDGSVVAACLLGPANRDQEAGIVIQAKIKPDLAGTPTISSESLQPPAELSLRPLTVVSTRQGAAILWLGRSNHFYITAGDGDPEKLPAYYADSPTPMFLYNGEATTLAGEAVSGAFSLRRVTELLRAPQTVAE